jgi:ubiquinone/menaquinone biosynthesis C-methylase UbiE
MSLNRTFQLVLLCSVLQHNCTFFVSAYEPTPTWASWRHQDGDAGSTVRRKLLISCAATTSTLLLTPTHYPSFALSPEEAATAYDTYATTYDDLDGGQVASALGIEAARARLIGQAKGDVLEIGVGTGLNLAKYPREGLSSLICVDISPGMLKEASMRLQSSECRNLQNVPVKFLQADATSDLVKMFGRESFDTVVDTFSLCVFGNEGAKRSLGLMRQLLRKNGKRCHGDQFVFLGCIESYAYRYKLHTLLIIEKDKFCCWKTADPVTQFWACIKMQLRTLPQNWVEKVASTIRTSAVSSMRLEW